MRDYLPIVRLYAASSYNCDISKLVTHDRFWTDRERKFAEVSSDFFLNFSCIHKHSRQWSCKKITGKLKEFTVKWKPVQESRSNVTAVCNAPKLHKFELVK